MADALCIPGTSIEVPAFITNVDGDFYSVPGHGESPKRRWRHAQLVSIGSEVDDEALMPGHDFLMFCRTRDRAKMTWRLPACSHGCSWCYRYRYLGYDLPEPALEDVPKTLTCAFDWWVHVPEGTRTFVSAAGPRPPLVTQPLEAMPWTDFSVAY